MTRIPSSPLIPRSASTYDVVNHPVTTNGRGSHCAVQSVSLSQPVCPVTYSFPSFFHSPTLIPHCLRVHPFVCSPFCHRFYAPPPPLPLFAARFPSIFWPLSDFLRFCLNVFESVSCCLVWFLLLFCFVCFLSVRLSVCLSVCLHACLSLCLSLSVCMSVSVSACLSVCLPACLSVCLSVCLSLSLSLSLPPPPSLFVCSPPSPLIPSCSFSSHTVLVSATFLPSLCPAPCLTSLFLLTPSPPITVNYLDVRQSNR